MRGEKFKILHLILEGKIADKAREGAEPVSCRI